MSHSTTTATSSTGSAKIHLAQAENVHVQSVVQTETQSKVSLENAKKINDLMARFERSLLKHKLNNNNFFLMLIYEQLVNKTIAALFCYV